MTHHDEQTAREALKPCPFCGFGSPLIAEDYNEDTGYKGWGVLCGNPECNCCVQDVYKTREGAITAWNTRTATTREAELLAVIRGMKDYANLALELRANSPEKKIVLLRCVRLAEQVV